MANPISLTTLHRLCGGLLLVGLGAGLGARFMSPLDHSAQPAVTCRPSDPIQAFSAVSEPVVLFWGNSLLFDHSWGQAGFAPVNCARQGQTLQAALHATNALPMIHVDAVVLAFGSVELIRPSPIDMDNWRSNLDAQIDALHQRYPDAQLFVTGIPTGPQSGAPWHYDGRPELEAMNSALSSVSETYFLDLSPAFAEAGVSVPHYDGVHLTRQAYRIWETMIAERLDR